MSRNVVSDVRPSEKRTIRILPSSSRGRASRSDLSEFNDQGSDSQEKMRKYILWGIVVGALAVLTFVVSSIFGGATITVTPRTEKVTANLVLTASKTQGADLMYQLITLSDQAQKQVEAQGTRMEEKKASGHIIIYNDSTTVPQRLIRNTRFQTVEGLVFRIAEPVVIPGKKAGTPGSIDVVVFADEPGPTFNIGLTDFTVPGFKTNPEKFKNIYARSKTTMTGGSKGVVHVVKDADAKAAREEMNADLKTRLLQLAHTQTPEGFIFFDRASLINFEQLPDQSKDAAVAALAQKATLTGLMLSKKALAGILATRLVENFDGKPVDFLDTKDIDVTPQNMAIGVFERDPIKLSITGSPTLVWGYDAASIKTALGGKKTAQFLEIMKAFPEVTPQKAVVRPIWKTSFPDEVARIKIVESTK